MRLGSRNYRRFTAAVKAVALLMLMVTLLAPKLSLAVVAAFGSGYSSVVICTGSGLKRVSVSPDGAIVSDDSGTGISTHCVMPDERTAELQRAWQRTCFPEFSAVTQVRVAPDIDTTFRYSGALSSRGPPALL